MKKLLLFFLIVFSTCALAYSQRGPEGSDLLAYSPSGSEAFAAGQDDNVMIYPNPVKSDLNILFPQKGDHTVKIYNIIGEKIAESTVYNEDHVRINLAQFQNGMYFISYEFAGKV